MHQTSGMLGVVGAKKQDAAGIFVFSPSVAIPRPADLDPPWACISGIVGQGSGLDFYNKTTGATTRLGDYVKDLQQNSQYNNLFYTANTIKNAPRAYSNVVTGNLRHAIKVVVRNNDGHSNVLFIYPGVPPVEGGKTWVISPHLVDTLTRAGVSLPPGAEDQVVLDLLPVNFAKCFEFSTALLDGLATPDQITAAMSLRPFLCVTDAVVGVVESKASSLQPGMIAQCDYLGGRKNKNNVEFSAGFFSVYDWLWAASPAALKLAASSPGRGWAMFVAALGQTPLALSSPASSAQPQEEEEVEDPFTPAFTLDVDAMF